MSWNVRVDPEEAVRDAKWELLLKISRLMKRHMDLRARGLDVTVVEKETTEAMKALNAMGLIEEEP